ncbi:hypothetical protein JW935_20450 [candidate division KSB1 bacterium]|nr:hypothetical protein [candidate division KSB1 bacterium]
MLNRHLYLVMCLFALCLFCNKDEPTKPSNNDPDMSKMIGPLGGLLNLNGFSFNVAPGSFEEEKEISVQEQLDEKVSYDQLSNISPVYLLGNLPSLAGPVTVSIGFEPGTVTGDDYAFIYLEEQVALEDGSEILLGRPLLNSQVDLDNHQVTVTIGTSVDGLAKSGGVNDAFESGDNTNTVKFTIVKGAKGTFTAILQDDNFIISYDAITVPRSYADKILANLSSAKQQSESLLMNFEKRSKPIPIHLVPQTNGSETAWGMYQRPFWSGLDGTYIEYRQDITDDILLPTVGHELFHLAQDCNGTFFKHWWNYKFTWLNDATAVWFEMYLMKDKEYVPGVITLNKNYIFNPLETENQDHGYGASTFITYLTDRQGTRFVYLVYSQIKNIVSKDKALGALAIQEALKLNSYTLSDEFRDFCFQYVSGTNRHQTASSSRWDTPESEMVRISPGADVQRTVSLTDLSAKGYHVVASIPAGDENTYTLETTVNGNSSDIAGAVYTMENGDFDLWHSFYSFQESSVRNFGRNPKIAKIVLVNNKAVWEFNTKVNFDFLIALTSEPSSPGFAGYLPSLSIGDQKTATVHFRLERESL